VNFDLEGRVAFVTGASSGIGRAAALGFGDEGARIAIGYHSNHANAEATPPVARSSARVRCDKQSVSTLAQHGQCRTT
jgi:NAD(P)-dependent dehydrogenase (short-subunit alcohol dehydrogenase family)